MTLTIYAGWILIAFSITGIIFLVDWIVFAITGWSFTGTIDKFLS